MSCDPESVSRTQMLWPFLAPPESSGELGRLGPYRVLKMLGQGGMGVVFKAEDVNLHRLVALKVMRPEISAQPRAKRDSCAKPARPQHSITTTLSRFIRLARIEACRFWQWNSSPENRSKIGFAPIVAQASRRPLAWLSKPPRA